MQTYVLAFADILVISASSFSEDQFVHAMFGQKDLYCFEVKHIGCNASLFS